MTGTATRVAGRVAGGREHYLAEFERLDGTLPGHSLAWVRALRRAALERFAELDFPAAKHEEWKYTSVAPITRLPFLPADGTAAAGSVTRGLEQALASGEATRLILVDGRLDQARSRLDALPAGVVVTGLEELLDGKGSRERAAQVKRHLGRLADHGRHAFTALNTAFFAGGAAVLVPAGVEVPEPIHLVHVATRRRSPTVNHVRHLVVAGEGSAVTILERYLAAATDGGGAGAGAGDSPSFTNAVTEIDARQGASVAHYRLEEESEADFHVGMLQARQERDSSLSSWSIATGASLARVEVRALLEGEGASAELRGLYLLHGAQHVDHQTLVDHAQPHGSSRQLYKGVMDGASRGVFTGRILVREGALKTDAHQTNRNLVLSGEALAEARPQLEIRTNDVACTHGVAIGRLDDDMIFYLRARGIAEPEARRILTRAFATEVLDTVRLPELRSELERRLAGWLAAGPAGAAS